MATRESETSVKPSTIFTNPDDFKTFVDHPVLIHHLDWTAVSAGSKCFSQNLVSAYFTLMNSSMKNKVSNFYYVKCGIKLKFVVQGAAQTAGMLAYTAFPAPKYGNGAATAAIVQSDTIANSRVAPHVLIDPSKSETLELILPMCTTTGFYSVSSANTAAGTTGSWELDYRFINPLISGTANSATVSVCVYMSLVDPVFSGLITTVALSPLKTEKTTSGSYSSIARSVAKVSSFVGDTFPIISPATTLFSTVSNTVGDVLAWFGFSKPQSVENLNAVLVRTADNYSQIDGISNALVLGRSQGQTVSISPSIIGGGLEDMSIQHLASIPSIAYQFSIAPAVASQTYVLTIPVTVADLSADPTINVPVLTGLAVAHQYWRGDLTYTFEFIASVFHRCTVLIAWRPTNSTTVPSFSDALTTLKNTTVYISGNTSVDITVPYEQPIPALPCYTSPTRSYNGYFFIYVINPVQSNGSTDSIYANVLIRSDNIEFLVPTTTIIQNPRFYTYAENSVDFAPSTVVVPLKPPSDWVEVVPVSFGTANSLENLGNVITGDATKSIKDLISRMCPPMTVDSQVALTNTYVTRPLPMIASTGTFATYLSYFMTAYVGSRGSTRVTLVGAGNKTYQVCYTPAPYVSTTMSGGGTWANRSPLNMTLGNYAFTGVNTITSANADVVIPMTANVNFYPGRNCGNGGSGTLSASAGYTGYVYFGPIGTIADNTLAIIKGAGDDFVLSGFIGFPRNA